MMVEVPPAGCAGLPSARPLTGVRTGSRGGADRASPFQGLSGGIGNCRGSSGLMVEMA